MATLKDELTAKVVEYEHWAKRRRFGRLTPIEFEAIMTTPRSYPIPSGHTTISPQGRRNFGLSASRPGCRAALRNVTGGPKGDRRDLSHLRRIRGPVNRSRVSQLAHTRARGTAPSRRRIRFQCTRKQRAATQTSC